MPRGYLKHKKGVGRKQARGGSSRSPSSRPAQFHCQLCGFELQGGKSNPPPSSEKAKSVSNLASDFVLTSPTNWTRKNTVSAKEYPVEECIICFQRCPVICLIPQCQWHGAACRKCLHRLYVTEAQKSAKKYPLECFHPQCKKTIRAGPLEQHQIFETPEEMKKHNFMLELSRIQAGKLLTVYCPRTECRCPNGIKKVTSEAEYGCKNCKYKFFVSPFYPTIRALENLNPDSFGTNNGWAMCPFCHIMISKGGGCSQMVCSNCNRYFTWDKAEETTMKKYERMARPPDEEIYLWWD